MRVRRSQSNSQSRLLALLGISMQPGMLPVYFVGVSPDRVQNPVRAIVVIAQPIVSPVLFFLHFY